MADIQDHINKKADKKMQEILTRMKTDISNAFFPILKAAGVRTDIDFYDLRRRGYFDVFDSTSKKYATTKDKIRDTETSEFFQRIEASQEQGD